MTFIQKDFFVRTWRLFFEALKNDFITKVLNLYLRRWTQHFHWLFKPGKQAKCDSGCNTQQEFPTSLCKWPYHLDVEGLYLSPDAGAFSLDFSHRSSKTKTQGYPSKTPLKRVQISYEGSSKFRHRWRIEPYSISRYIWHSKSILVLNCIKWRLKQGKLRSLPKLTK